MHLTPEQQVTDQNTSPKQLTILATQSIETLKLVAKNLNTPPETLRKLADIGDKDIRREVASNPNTPPETLRKLADMGDKDIRREVASNPNTPTDLLLNLGTEFPGELLNNPVFSLLLLENLNLLEEMPWKTRGRLYDYKGTPPELRSRLSEFIHIPF